MDMLARATVLSLLLLQPGVARASDAQPAAAPATPPAPALTSAMTRGRGLTVPIPSAYSEMQEGGSPEMDAIVKAGGVTLIETFGLDLKDAFRASLVVKPITKLDIDPTDPAACTAFAGRMGKGAGAKVQSARVVDLKVGKTCQWELTGFAEPSRAGRGTIVPGPVAWMVSCDYDVRDRPAQEGCGQLLDGWHFGSTKLTPAEKAYLAHLDKTDPECEFKAVHAHKEPRALLDEFLYRAARGDFLRTEAWLVTAVTCPAFLPAPDEHTVVEGYRVVSFSVKGKSAKTSVEYRYLGKMRLRLDEERRTGTVPIEMTMTPFGWRISDGLEESWQNVVKKVPPAAP